MTSKAVSCGVLVLNQQGELLLGHATGSVRWDIPKGIAEAGETTTAAALRELAEETGLRLQPEALSYVGRFGYIRGKDLELFAAVVDGIDPAQCLCTSMFRDAKGRERPELDAFRWAPWSQLPQLCGRSLVAVLSTIDRESLLTAGIGRSPDPV